MRARNPRSFVLSGAVLWLGMAGGPATAGPAVTHRLPDPGSSNPAIPSPDTIAADIERTTGAPGPALAALEPTPATIAPPFDADSVPASRLAQAIPPKADLRRLADGERPSIFAVESTTGPVATYPVPEPGSILLIATGLLGLLARRRLRGGLGS